MPRKKFFTPDQANAMLPLVRRIVEDISSLACELRERHQRHQRLVERYGKHNVAHREEMDRLENEMDQGQERMQELEREIGQLGILLKDYFIGLIDFPCLTDGREVYLCWKLGEPEVSHWHEIDVGFAGRQKLMTLASGGC